MTVQTGADPKTESYLARVRVALHGLPEGEIDDILRELRSHIADLAGEEGRGIDAAIRSLGDPVDLAKTYKTDNELVRAECSGSTLNIFLGLRHASRTYWGRLTVTVLYVLGYILVINFWLTAINKFFFPSTIGLWHTPGNFWSLTWVITGAAPAGAQEILGWWIVPIAGAAGWVLKLVVDRIAQWWIGRYRRSKASQEA